MQIEHQYYLFSLNIIKYYPVLKQLYTNIHISARAHTYAHDVSEVGSVSVSKGKVKVCTL
jgi:hypothetical protein